MTRRPSRRAALMTLVVAASAVLVLAAGTVTAGAGVSSAGAAVPAGGSAAVAAPGLGIAAWSSALVTAAPPPSATAQGTAPARRGSVTLFSDDFDVFPGSWDLFGTPTWGLSSFKAKTGEFSAYCIGSQSATPPANGYPPSVKSWMQVGPFDLSGWTAGSVSAAMLLKMVTWDAATDTGAKVMIMASVDNVTFYGPSYYTGDQGDVFKSATLDLTAIPTIGSVCGKPAVWIAFIFMSSAGPSGGLPGVFVDEVRIVGTVAAPTLASVKPASGKVGAWVTIAGTDFGATRGASYVAFGSKKAVGYKAWTATSLKVKVPAGLKKGSVKVRVNGPGGASNTKSFVVK